MFLMFPFSSPSFPSMTLWHACVQILYRSRIMSELHQHHPKMEVGSRNINHRRWNFLCKRVLSWQTSFKNGTWTMTFLSPFKSISILFATHVVEYWHLRQRNGTKGYEDTCQPRKKWRPLNAPTAIHHNKHFATSEYLRILCYPNFLWEVQRWLRSRCAGIQRGCSGERSSFYPAAHRQLFMFIYVYIFFASFRYTAMVQIFVSLLVFFHTRVVKPPKQKIKLFTNSGTMESAIFPKKNKQHSHSVPSRFAKPPCLVPTPASLFLVLDEKLKLSPSWRRQLVGNAWGGT